MFIIDNPALYAPAAGVSIGVITVSVPAPEVAISADTATAVSWLTLPDILLTVAVPTFDLRPYAKAAQNIGAVMTFAVHTGSLPAGVSLSTAGVLTYDGVTGSASASGIVFRATLGASAAITATVFAPSVSVAATATQAASGAGSTATLTVSVPAPTAFIAADATSINPSGTRYPNYDTPTSMTQAERFFDDSDSPAAVWNSHDAYAYPSGSTQTNGWYIGGEANVGTGINHGNLGTAHWRTAGGDWYGKTNVYRDTTTANCFALSSLLTNVNGEQLATLSGSDLTSLVNSWVAGTQPNYGFMLDLDNSNAVWLRSRWVTDTTKRPTMTVTTTGNGTVTLACARSSWIQPTSDIPSAKNLFLELNGTWRGLLAFDTSSLSGTVTAVTINVWAYQFFPAASGTEHIRVWQLWNPNDITTTPASWTGFALPAVSLGISALQGSADANIASHPSVLMYEDFHDSGSGTDYQGRFTPGSQAWRGATLMTAASDTNGWSKLFGTQNALRVGPPSSDGTVPAIIDATWQPWAGSYTHLRALQHCDELYFRYYLFLGNNFDPWPMNYKMPGFTGQYFGIFGMGRGNGGSSADGNTGWSCRGAVSPGQHDWPLQGSVTSDGITVNYQSFYAPLSGTSTAGTPLDRFRGYNYADAYFPDMQAINGPLWNWDIGYLAQLEKGRWYCIEMRARVNSVTDATAKPQFISSATCDGTVATYNLAAAGPALQVGQLISLGAMNPRTYQGSTLNPSARTIVALGAMTPGVSSTWWFQCGSSTEPVSTTTNMTAPSGLVPFYCASVGNYDGIMEAWVNGRKAMSRTNHRFRHGAWCLDGVTPYAIDGARLSVYHGGNPPDISNWQQYPCQLYMSNIVVATSYIGPAVGFP